LPQTIESSGSTAKISSIGVASWARPKSRTTASSTPALTIVAM
jgi:hypothetical protein